MVKLSDKNKLLSRFGFSFGRGGAHTSRTMMLEELRTLLSYVARTDTEKNIYLQSIMDENCLGKRSVKTRRLTYRHLVELYSLDRKNVVFRALLYFWHRDIDGQPLLAMLCAYARDPIFRSSALFILKFPEGTTIKREALEEYIDSQEPGRFSKATLKSTAQNINSTWTKTGHLRGCVRKVRSRAHPTAGSVSYALFLGYLTGIRGILLFQTEYIKVLDCSFNEAVSLAEEASRKGWIKIKRVDDVIEVLFPNLIKQEELEWLCEQN